MGQRGVDDRLDVPDYRFHTIYGQAHVYAGPLFIHQLSHLWIDFRGAPDGYMRERALDYFEKSRRTTLIQHDYAVRNPCQYACYNAYCWGIPAGGWLG